MTEQQTPTHVPHKEHRAIRNVIFNEMGVTKRDIDQAILKIVHERVAALIKGRDGLGPLIEKIIRSEVFRYKDLTALVAAEVKKVVAEHVAANLAGRLSVEIATKSPTEGALSHTKMEG